MNTKLFSGMSLAALLVVSGIAGASTFDGDKSSISPSSVDITGVGGFGVAVCDFTDATPIGCSAGGVSAIFVLDTDAGTSGDWDSTTDTDASGTCSADSASGQQLTIFCGVDRNDDVFVTNSPAAPARDSARGYDDDAVGGTNTASFDCFRRDLGNDPTDPVNDGNGDWDTVAVFVGFTVPSLVTPEFVTISLDMTSANTSCAGEDF